MSHPINPDDVPTVELPAVLPVESPCETTLPQLLPIRIEEPAPVVYEGPRPPLFGWLRWPLGMLLVLLTGCGIAVVLQFGQPSVPPQAEQPAAVAPKTSTPLPPKPEEVGSERPAKTPAATHAAPKPTVASPAETTLPPVRETTEAPQTTSSTPTVPTSTTPEETSEPTTPSAPSTEPSTPPATEESTTPPASTEPASPAASESTLP